MIMRQIKIIWIIFVVADVVYISDSLEFIAKPFNGKLLNVHIDDNITISCQTNDPSANVTLFLYSTETNKVTIQEHFKNHKNQLKIEGQVFHIYSVTIEEWNSYRCVARAGENDIVLELGLLVVSPVPCVSIPSLSLNVNVWVYEQFDEIQITCSAPGRDGEKNVLNWTKKNSSLVLNQMVLRDGKVNRQPIDNLMLKISNAGPTDEGEYICTRTFCNLTTSQSIKLLYKEPYKPTISVNYSGVPKSGNSITIQCLVDSSPKSNIEWYSDILIHTCNNSKMCESTVQNYTSRKNFTCVAKNSKGMESKSELIDVLIPPVIVLYNPPAADKESKRLGCKVTHGSPLPFINWEQEVTTCKNKISCETEWVSLSSSNIVPSVNVPTSESIIIFQKSQKNIGHVRCNAYNSVGNYSVTAAALSFPNEKGQSGSVIGIVCGFLLVVFIFVLIMFFYKRHMNKKFALFMEPNPKFKFDPDRTLFEQSIELPYDLSWEFPRDRLDFVRVIGSGAFGQVWFAHARGILALCPRDKSSSAARQRAKLRLNKKVPKSLLNLFTNSSMCDHDVFVAVKTLKSSPSNVEYKDLASEIKVLIHLGEHQNIVNLLGACTKDGHLCAIIEYCPHGNLVGFLRPRRQIFSLQWDKQAFNFDEDFCWFDAANAALQIANGMLFLSEKKLVHRDLAARNVLVGPDYVMKVADFGLARDIYTSDVYFKESSGILPVKWMAPESLFDKIYTIKSDVWSFGIVLWEICTMGGSPYPGLPTEDLFDYLTTGKRMSQPVTCPDELYEIMVQCWQERLEERPWFHEIVSQLQRIVESKVMLADSLSHFERIQSVSDETTYLVPISPCKKKSSVNSLGKKDNLLKANTECAFNFPPIEDTSHLVRNKEPHLDPINESGYIGLRSDPAFSKDESKISEAFSL